MKYRNITYHHTSTQDLRLLELPKERYQLPGFQTDGANIVALNQSSPHKITIYLITFLKYVNMTIKKFNIVQIHDGDDDNDEEDDDDDDDADAHDDDDNDDDDDDDEDDDDDDADADAYDDDNNEDDDDEDDDDYR